MSEPSIQELRVDRFARLVGPEAIERLGRSHVIVVGVGGVGSFTVEALARSGIGHLTLIDGERVSATNLNRQLHALMTTLGQPKVEAMAARLAALDPALRVTAIHDRYDETSAERLVPIDGSADVVVDAIDNVTAKMHLIARCHAAHLPIVSSMGAAGRLDPTQIMAGDLCETRQDHFARDVRKFLRRCHGIDCKKPTGVFAVWSREPGRKALRFEADEACGIPEVSPDVPGIRGPRCQASAVFVTAAMGMAVASVVIRELLKLDAD
ncbi:MAG: tRNA threonylcarbamoyladenosine dehydratase [Myxococcales bacterium]|jgi:tRNA A37 threonylcarbamoyladenosine dehydratase|nr:tRNA threonylcarbamoyladenosine dehydratase [Myxococcales bacterium]